MHDGSPEAVASFPATKAGSKARFFYSPKATKRERERGLDALPKVVVDPSRAQGSAGRNNPRAGAGRRGDGRANSHPCVKPLALMRWMVRLVCAEGGIVLDPFAGSGTTGIACALEGFGFIGCELSPEYWTIATERIAHAKANPSDWE